MGLPLTSQILTGGSYEAFPIYVWFADYADGPVWSVLDREFDKWDANTGKSLVFFIDPFHNENWAKSFLNYLEINSELSKNILTFRKKVQNFYRNNLARNIAKSMWIDQNMLPLAIISISTESDICALAKINNEDDLFKLFHILTIIGNQFLRKSGSAYNKEKLNKIINELNDKEIETRLHQFNFNKNIKYNALDSCNKETLIPFTKNKILEKDKEEKNQINITDQANLVAKNTLIDLLELSTEIIEPMNKLKQRYPNDREIYEVNNKIVKLNSILDNLSKVSHKINSLSSKDLNSDEIGTEIIEQFNIFSSGFLNTNTDDKLIQLLGIRTFSGILEDSKTTMGVSELIFELSSKIEALNRDMTTILVGYWKACELEGFRALTCLIDNVGYIEYDDGYNLQSLNSNNLIANKFTMGKLSFIFTNLKNIEGIENIHKRKYIKLLGEKLQLIKDTFRNRYTHKDLLRSEEIVSQARQQVGCNNPDGLLQTVIEFLGCLGVLNDSYCIDELKEQENKEINFQPKADLSTIINQINKNNANDYVPKFLSQLNYDDEKRNFAKAVIDKLGHKWLTEKKRSQRDWVKNIYSLSEHNS